MAGFDNEVMYGTGIDLSGAATPSNRLNVDGALYIGNSTGNPQATVPTSSDDVVSINVGAGTLDFSMGTGLTDTFLQQANNLSDVDNVATSRTNLGLGSMAVQSASGVDITGGSITGITDLAIADGGTAASTAADARTNLGLAIGTNVQAWDQGLQDISALAVTDGNIIVGDGANWVAESGATARTSLGLGSIATQSASSVSITGGTITGITDLAVADGGTGASTAGDARTNLGLGTIATQSAASVAITGGSITGITDLVVADGGTGASSFTAYAVVCGGTTGTGALQSIAGVGSSGEVLTSNGAGTLPTFQAAGGGGDYTLISTATASASASISFTGLSSTYFAYKVLIQNVLPATDAVFLQMRTSSNGGSSYDSGASDYSWVNINNEATTITAARDTADDKIDFHGTSGAFDWSNGSNAIGAFEITIYNPSAANYCQVVWIGGLTGTSAALIRNNGIGQRLAAADVDAIQFFFSSGNISTGTFKLYGISAS